MSDELFLIIDSEGECIGIGTREEIAGLVADGVVPADATLRAVGAA